jgi:hypothetical protein
MALLDRILDARQGKIIEEMSIDEANRTEDHVRRRALTAGFYDSFCQLSTD